MHPDQLIGIYIEAHVLLNLLNKLEKRDKMQGLPSMLSLSCNKFNKFKSIGAQNFRFYLSHDLKIAF